jgi:benzoate membrane transport protein
MSPPLPIEPAAGGRPGPRQVWRDLGGEQAANGFIGFIFAATGPVAIILSVGSRGGLSEAELASWIFGAFFLNSLVTLGFSWTYRQPLVFFWSIPGAVLVGPALVNLSFPEVVGAFIVTGVLMALLALTGWVRRAMQLAPMPIVMGMVAGVFLRFGTDMIHALRDDVAIAAPMVAAFLLLSAVPRLGRMMPPVIGALAVGVVAMALTGSFAPAGAQDASAGTAAILAAPVLQVPQWSWQAMFELVVPLAITVLVVQNGQGFAVLDNAGHRPPVNAITLACGIGSVASAFVGSVSTCLTGPTNAIVAASGPRERHYAGALVVAALAIGFGLMSPLFTRWALAAPQAFIATVAGLAMLRVLQSAFTVSFRDRFTLGALVTFLVTVADVSVLNIGAPFWGLLSGFAVSWLLERKDFGQAPR